MGSRGIKEVVLLVMAVMLVVVGAFLGVGMAQRTSQPDYIIALPDVATVFVPPAVTVRPTFTPLLATPAIPALVQGATSTPEAVATSLQPVPIQNSPTAAANDVTSVTFQVVVSEIYFYAGPGSAYPPIAIAREGAVLPVVSRTADGLWWQVCCMDGVAVWLPLDGKTILASGDANYVPVSDALVYNLAPTELPVPMVVTPVGGVETALDAALRADVPAPTAAPVLEPGNPACNTGATYATIPPIGDVDRRPAALNPEINLSLRSYSYVDGFRQMVGIGGDTDVHAPQFNTLFADKRITQDFPTVYRAHEWDYNCNCRGAPINAPEVTVLGVSTRQGEVLYTPARTQGDIGGGYAAMVLYASPNSITLKYTREDNMLMGYGLHLEGICVDPNLLALYRQLDQAGRGQLPVLHGGQPIGFADGGELKIAVRDTGQFMDPRSQKDWWVGN
jgi:hypothetical protein